MPAILAKVCRVANKVALNTRYAAATTDQAVSKVRLLDAFSLTGDLLFDLRQSNIRDAYEQMFRFLAGYVERLDLDGAEWSAAVTQHSDRLHQARVHEKTIKIVGDELSRWQFQTPDSKVLNSSLDQLEYVAICEAERLAGHWHTVTSAGLSERAATIFRVHCGLAVLAVTLADAPAVESERWCTAAIAAFGATLVVDGSHAIFEEARQLARV